MLEQKGGSGWVSVDRFVMNSSVVNCCIQWAARFVSSSVAASLFSGEPLVQGGVSDLCLLWAMADAAAVGRAVCVDCA